MENSIFSGSENLYKYLVTVGILLIVLTIYYPLKEKQDLEILTVQLKSELQSLNFKIETNRNEAESFNTNQTQKNLEIIKKNQFQNQLNQISLENKYTEIKCRNEYIKMYNWIFWIFLPLGIILIIFGFIRWYISKRIDDEVSQLEKQKLEEEIRILRTQ